MRACLVGLSVVFCAAVGWAEDGSGGAAVHQVVVTANRLETPLEEVGSSVTVVDARQIDERGLPTLAEVLKSVPGLDVVSSGPQGGNIAFFLRGANSEHTLVLVDGMEVNDPISPTRAFNFADFPSTDIERIEILRGPQSTLYGSDAMGGVIAIYTKSGSGKTLMSASAEAGSFDTFREHISVGGGDKALNYYVGVSRQDSGGISAAERSDGNHERDGYRNTSFAGRVAGEFSPTAEAGFNLRYTRSNAELDNGGGVGGDDPNRHLDREQLVSRAELKTHLFDGRLSQTLGAGVSFQAFDDDNDTDADHSLDVLRSNFTSRLYKADFQNAYRLADPATVVLGLETEHERGSSSYFSDGEFGAFTSDLDERSTHTNSAYSQLLLEFADSFNSALGIRVDDHSKFGTKVSWRVAPAYRIKSSGTKLSASVGTGFKAPSLFQLYSSFGNEDLAPERSLGLDAGIEQKLFDNRVSVATTFFWNKFHDLISFNPDTFISENIARARTSGFENAVNWEISSRTSVRAAYTYTQTLDQDTGASLLRRPRHKLGLDLVVKPIEKLTLDCGIVVVGHRNDNDFSTFPATTTRLGTYTLVNVTGSYALTNKLELFARVENLFDRSYQDVLGFGEPGVAGYGGIRVKL